MSVENYDRITENTASSKDQCVQLIFIDGVPSGYCHKVSNARILIEDIADKLERDLQTDGKRVFRETSDDGTEIKISRQSIGYIVDGGVALKHTLSFRSVPKYTSLKQKPHLFHHNIPNNQPLLHHMMMWMKQNYLNNINF